MIAGKTDSFDPAGLGPDFVEAFRFLRKMPPDFPKGKTVLSDRVYVNVMEYDSDSPWAPGELEAHRKYADLQAVLTGAEAVAWAPCGTLPVTKKYVEESDVMFHNGSGVSVSRIELKPGLFAIFYPGDGHFGKFAPAGGPCLGIRKAVFKIQL